MGYHEAMPSLIHDPLSDTIRDAFQQSGMSIKRLATLSGIPYSAAHGIVNATRDPQLTTAAKLCEVLGLELRVVRKPKATAKSPAKA